MSTPTAPPPVELAWPLTARSVPRARHALAELLAEWELSSLTDSAGLVLSELMTNAVNARVVGRECRTVFRRLPTGVHIEVHDPSPLLPVLREPRPLAESGRGLPLVALLTDGHWGTTPRDGIGKLVWAEVTEDDG
ncbi:ATP-binding protein [Actinacidiphila alni]|uniref:ATP-binding protein n=1 Tax=Actinacidiphila alni TaxID=380248 RepID=UPI00345152B8